MIAWLYKNIKTFRSFINYVLLDKDTADKLLPYCGDFIDVLIRHYDKNILIKYIVLICISKKRRILNNKLFKHLDNNRVTTLSVIVQYIVDQAVFNKLFLSNKFYRKLIIRMIGNKQLLRVRKLFHRYVISQHNGKDCSETNDIEQMILQERYCTKFNCPR